MILYSWMKPCFLTVLVLCGCARAASQAARTTPVDLPAEVYSYYKVVHADQHIGWIYGRLSRDSKSGLRTYERAERWERDTPETISHEARIIATGVDNTFIPETCAVELYAGGASKQLTWERGEEPLQVLPTLLLYGLRQNGSLAAPQELKARMVDPSGRERQGIDVNLQVGETTRRESFNGMATVTKVTFLKPYPSAGSESAIVEAWVDRYGRIVEATLGSGAQITLVRDEREAFGDLRRLFSASRGCRLNGKK